MKIHACLCFFCASLCAVAGESQGLLTLAERGKDPVFTIVLPREPSPSQCKAAEELQDHVRQMTGVLLPVATNAMPGRAIFLGGGDEGLGEDGFRIVARPPHLHIEGSRVHGTLFGVYDFLERYCGCEWFSPRTTVVPRRDRITVPGDLDDRQIPAFKFRDANWWDHLHDHVWEARLKMDGFRIEYPESLGGRPWRKDTTTGGATFDVLCPASKHFKDNPEWFALLKGKRVGERSQRCLTNPGFLDFLVSNVFARAARNYPACKYYSLYQNDRKYPCECADCRAIDEREGSAMGTMLHMANYVAERVSRIYPDITILTFSYMYTLKPPKTLRPHPNVMIVYCTDQCDFSKPLTESRWKGSRSFVRGFREWKKICKRLYVWDYSANFECLVVPFSCVHVMRDNFRFYREMGAVGVFEEGDHYRYRCTDEHFKTWIMAHLMWDPDQPLEPLLERFFNGYYGAAAPVARWYYEGLVDIDRKRNEEKDPSMMIGTGLNLTIPISFVNEASRRFRDALELVKDDPVRRENVQWALNQIDWYRLLRASSAGTFILSRDPSRFLAEAKEMRDIARRLAEEIKADPAIGRKRNKTYADKFFKLVESGDAAFSPAERVVVEDRYLAEIPRDGSRRVKDPKAADGSALRIEPTAPSGLWHTTKIHITDFTFDKDCDLGIRVRLRAEKTGESGWSFQAGTCNMRTWKRDIRCWQLHADSIPDDGEYHWYDVDGSWRGVDANEVLWLGVGSYNKKKFSANPTVRGVFIDKIEVYLKPRSAKK